MSSEGRYFEPLAAAFARGRLGLPRTVADAEAIDAARGADLKLHKFKRQSALPRVRRVIGALRGIAPSSVVDVGSGRGTFLWPMLDAFPELRVVAIDLSDRRARDLHAVRAGGIERLSAGRMGAQRMALAAKSADVVTILEVLEHLPEPALAVSEAIRIARRFVVASVPSHEDENPEHIHLFDPRTLAAMFEKAGASRVSVDHVHDHAILIAGLP